MNQQELKHEWSIDPNAGWFRPWQFVYESADPNSLTFCRLFWGFVFMVPASVTYLPIRYIAKLLREIWTWLGLVGEAHSLKTRKRREERIVERAAEPPKPPKPPREAVLLPKIETLVTRAKMAYASLPIKSPIKLTTFAKIVGYVGLALGALALAAFVGGAVWGMILGWPITGFALGGLVGLALVVLALCFLGVLIYDHPEETMMVVLALGAICIVGGIIWAGITFWTVVQSILIIGAVGAVALLFIVGIGWATIRYGSEPLVDYFVRPTHEHVLRPAARGVADGGIGFATVMKLGYRAVKTNTCPRITIASDQKSGKVS